MFRGKEFFQNAFDTQDATVEQVIDTPLEADKVKEVVDADVTPSEVVTEKVADVVKPEVPTFELDGEKITAEQIKEWKQNGLRQSDYTKKTQELAEQRKVLEAKGISIEDTSSSESQRIAKLERDVATRDLDSEITRLKTLYPDFDEVKVLNEAQRRGIYNDLDFIYKATREDNSSPVNVEELKTQAIEQYKIEIALKKQSNNEATSGSIVSSTPAKPIVDYADELTSYERDFAKKRGLTDKEYAEQKSAVYSI